jgi:transcriptional regulator with XRE-family HTH domain
MEGQTLFIGDRLRALREERKLSQGDIEKKTGLLRCYVFRVENGDTIPAVETQSVACVKIVRKYGGK